MSTLPGPRAPGRLDPRLAARLRLGLFWSLIALILLYMTIPAIVVIVTSFSPTQLIRFPPSGFSLKWYVHAFGYPDFQSGFLNSLIVTFFASTLALVAGSALAYLLDRHRFRGRAVLEAVLAAPLVVPYFTTGFGFLLLGVSLGIQQSYAIVVVTLTVLVLPFVTRSVYVSLRNLDPNFERAAANLGASPGRVFFRITVPLLLPGLIGGWLIAAILAFTEFTASLFVTDARTQTLPVAMYNYIREYTDPSIAAISAILIVGTMIIMFIADRYVGLDRILSIDAH
ncbi:MAG: ABC transporter permease [Acetobacteraceae bacterium]